MSNWKASNWWILGRIGTEYWTYYRLVQSGTCTHQGRKEGRPSIATALDHRRRSRRGHRHGDLRTAFDQDLRALLAMKDYWGENDQVELDGTQVSLVNELYADLQKLTSGVQLTILPTRCDLSYANRFKRELLISAVHRNG